jgi:hypothetical protein
VYDLIFDILCITTPVLDKYVKSIMEGMFTNMGRSPNYDRNNNIFHITNGLNSLHRKWYTGNQYMVKSAENRCAVIWKGAGRFVTWSFRTRSFRTEVKMYSETFRTFFSTHRFVINSLIKMLYVELKLWNYFRLWMLKNDAKSQCVLAH